MTSWETIRQLWIDDEVARWRFELEAAEAERLGYQLRFWAEVQRKVEHNKTFIGRMTKRWR